MDAAGHTAQDSDTPSP